MSQGFHGNEPSLQEELVQAEDSALGLCFSIDDFGYSSLAYRRPLPNGSDSSLPTMRMHWGIS